MTFKTDFDNFRAGTIFNAAKVKNKPKLTLNKISISYPSRLEAMALDPSRIVDNNNLVYEAGQINFSIRIFKDISVSIDRNSTEITTSKTNKRKALVLHAALLMKQALGFNEGLHIDVHNEVDLRHCGLGSSSSLIAGTAAAINEMFGSPIDRHDLVQYCAQNHGEEVGGSDTELVPVQCIGGSAVGGHYDGGLIILAGQASPIYRFNFETDIPVVIGVPEDFSPSDSKELMDLEIENISGFEKTGSQYGREIAYRLVHEVMPGLQNGNLKNCKSLIFDYRWNMGSIDNCSFVYPRMKDIAKKLRPMEKDDDIEIISLSSVGPGFFAITKKPDLVTKKFNELGLKTYGTSTFNGTYQITNKQDAK